MKQFCFPEMQSKGNTREWLVRPFCSSEAFRETFLRHTVDHLGGRDQLYSSSAAPRVRLYSSWKAVRSLDRTILGWVLIERETQWLLVVCSRQGALLHLDLQYPAPDDGEDQADEEEEGDGSPVLHCGPVVSDEDPDMFDADEDRKDTPGEQEAVAGLKAAGY